MGSACPGEGRDVFEELAKRAIAPHEKEGPEQRSSF